MKLPGIPKPTPTMPRYRRNRVVDIIGIDDDKSSPPFSLCDGVVVGRRFKKIGTFYLYMNIQDLVLGTANRLIPEFLEKSFIKVYRIFWDREARKICSEIYEKPC